MAGGDWGAACKATGFFFAPLSVAIALAVLLLESPWDDMRGSPALSCAVNIPLQLLVLPLLVLTAWDRSHSTVDFFESRFRTRQWTDDRRVAAAALLAALFAKDLVPYTLHDSEESPLLILHHVGLGAAIAYSLAWHVPGAGWQVFACAILEFGSAFISVYHIPTTDRLLLGRLVTASWWCQTTGHVVAAVCQARYAWLLWRGKFLVFAFLTSCAAATLLPQRQWFVDGLVAEFDGVLQAKG